MKIIPLGRDCMITFILMHLKIKKLTTLFEYFFSPNFNSICKCIEYIVHGNIIAKKIKIKQKKKYNYIESDGIYLKSNDQNIPEIFSYHYKFPNGEKIIERRIKRFLTDIKNNSSILFLRLNNKEKIKIKKEDMEYFFSIIKKINPNIKIHFLLIDTLDNKNEFEEIKFENVFHKFILKKDILESSVDPHYFIKNNEKLIKFIKENIEYINNI